MVVDPGLGANAWLGAGTKCETAAGSIARMAGGGAGKSGKLTDGHCRTFRGVLVVALRHGDCRVWASTAVGVGGGRGAERWVGRYLLIGSDGRECREMDVSPEV
jgi:hypothetical protein